VRKTSSPIRAVRGIALAAVGLLVSWVIWSICSGGIVSILLDLHLDPVARMEAVRESLAA
jgi:hypothetical protein